MYYPIKDYRLLGFRKSDRTFKKYYALLEHRINKNLVKVHFGDNRYQHYRDITGLSDYNYLNHNDDERRDRYRQRHSKDIKKGFFNPGYFSYYYLW